MRRALACAIAALALTQGSPAHATSVHETAVQAYIYGRAMLAEQRVIANFPPNLLINVTQLTTPAQRLVPAPNVDTLYTVARLIVGGGPQIVHVPEEHNRYYTFQFLDAYTNSFAYVGRRTTGTAPGDYAILPPGWHGALPPGVHAIRSPTPVVWLLGRTVVNGPDDLPAVQAIQRQYSLRPLNGQPRASLFVPSSALHPPPIPSGLAYWDALGALMAQSPPPVRERALMRSFAQIGVGPGLQPSQEKLAPRVLAALNAAAATATRRLAGYAKRITIASQRAHNGWLLAPAGVGDFGADYLLRAYIADHALGANVPAEAIYPFAFVDAAGHKLSGGHRYVLHFAAHQLPPVKAFWSLTMYDGSIFLVPNPIGRYAVGDRTAGLRRNRDGSLDVLIQRTRPSGPRASNWLPSPAGRFILALRLYEPRPAAIMQRWPLPRITVQR
ncbi:MAG: DUF1254 domain-containing protein [Solirubrobacteraceae bacterium]